MTKALVLEHKSYIATIEPDEDDETLWHGRVVNTRDVISFYGRTPVELQEELAKSVEEYLAFCKEQGTEPERPFSGKFQLRLTSELHQRVAIAATRAGKSINAFITELLTASTLGNIE
jgi:predicted HicB family RNase H-like nuclease